MPKLESLALFCASFLLHSGLRAQGPLVTVAEATRYERTSTHEETLRFLDELVLRGAPVRLFELGRSTEGRPLRAVLLSNPPVANGAEAQRLGRPIVYVQGNIHAGEVCAKEAVLALVRDLALGEQRALLDQLVVIALPDYNPDGNEAFAPVARNRPGQMGPIEVGRRANAAGLDLNRDAMKAESAEMRALLDGVLNAFDPDLLIDGHTTNGSPHGYQLTYAPPLMPVPAAGPTTFVRDVLLPEVRSAVRETHGYQTFDYGNLGRGDEPTWRTYEWYPRYVTNYVALRGRMAILSEGYSYATFETRVRATYAFCLEILRAVARHAETIRALHGEADRQVLAWGRDPAQAKPWPVDFAMTALPEKVSLLIDTWVRDESANGRGRRHPAGHPEPRDVTVFDRFEADRYTSATTGFLLPASMQETVRTLLRHGVTVERLQHDVELDVETFTPETVSIDARPFQGHRITRLRGTYARERRATAAGTYFVPTAQRLGMLAYYLLEPTFDDGLAAWGGLGFEPSEGNALPYVRVPRVPLAARHVVTSLD